MTTTKKLYRVRLLPNNHVSQDKQTLGYLATNNRIGVYGKAYAIKLAYEYHGVIEPNEQEVGQHDIIGFYSYEVYPGHQADFFAPLPYTDMEIGTEINFAELGFSKKQFFGSVIGTSTYSPKRIVKLEAIMPIDKAIIKCHETINNSLVKELYNLAEEMGIMLESKYWTEKFRDKFNAIMNKAEQEDGR